MRYVKEPREEWDYRLMPATRDQYSVIHAKI